MRPGWVVLRWLGLLILLVVGIWLGERLAGAEEQRPREIPRRANETPGRVNEIPRRVNNVPAPRVPVTPPGFPFGAPGGSANPANAGDTPQMGFRYHP